MGKRAMNSVHSIPDASQEFGPVITLTRRVPCPVNFYVCSSLQLGQPDSLTLFKMIGGESISNRQDTLPLLPIITRISHLGAGTRRYFPALLTDHQTST